MLQISFLEIIYNINTIYVESSFNSIIVNMDENKWTEDKYEFWQHRSSVNILLTSLLHYTFMAQKRENRGYCSQYLSSRRNMTGLMNKCIPYGLPSQINFYLIGVWGSLVEPNVHNEHFYFVDVGKPQGSVLAPICYSPHSHIFYVLSLHVGSVWRHNWWTKDRGRIRKSD